MLSRIICRSIWLSLLVVDSPLKFTDSFQFITGSLAELVDNLPTDNFKYTKVCFGDKTDLMRRKGAYPYDYMDSFERFKETTLPTKEKFYSKLNDEDITER